jgi:hypothetical protein
MLRGGRAGWKTNNVSVESRLNGRSFTVLMARATTIGISPSGPCSIVTGGDPSLSGCGAARCRCGGRGVPGFRTSFRAGRFPKCPSGPWKIPQLPQDDSIPHGDGLSSSSTASPSARNPGGGGVAGRGRRGCRGIRGRSRFRRQLAEDLLARAWEQLRDAERRHGRPFYTILRCRVEHPDATSQELAERLSERLEKTLTAGNLRVLVHRARDKFAEFLLEEVAASLDSGSLDHLEQELIDLRLHDYCRDMLARLRQRTTFQEENHG